MRRRFSAAAVCAVSILLLSGCATQLSPIHITDFCTEPAAVDHTACIAAWVDAGRNQPHRTLYASAGLYKYANSAPIYSRMRLECASAEQTTFKNIGGNGVFLRADAPVTGLRISDCGFDVNGNGSDFLTVIAINPPENPVWSSDIHVRRNRIFDSALTSGTSTMQRQYILLTKCQDCRVAGNHLTAGGRIKVGRPGRQLVIRGNTVEDANDNAITVADLNDGVSQDIRIEGNRVVNPVGIGIYFGADSDKLKWPLMSLHNVLIEDNYIEGNWNLACILGRLPATSAHIRVRENICVKTGPSVQGASAIRIKRSCEAAQPASEIRVARNVIRAKPPVGPGDPPALDHGGISFSGIHTAVRIVDNEVRNVGGRGIFLRHVVIDEATVQGNILLGGSFVIEGSVSGVLQTNTQSPSAAAIPEPCTP